MLCHVYIYTDGTDLRESDVITLPSHEPCSDFELYLQSYFKLPSTYKDPLRLPWNKEYLCDMPMCLSRCVFIRVIPLNYLISLISAVLLERKVFIKSEYPCCVSGTISFLIDAIQPFRYESPVISVLTDGLFDLIDSPTPLIVGCFKVPEELPEDSVLYDIDTKTMKVFGPDIILIPHSQQIIVDMKDILQSLKKVPSHSTVQCIINHTQPIEWAMQKVQIVLRLMFEEFEDFCISSRDNNGHATTLFMRDEFISTQPAEFRPFLMSFFNTQMFENYRTRRLVEIDRKKEQKASQLSQQQSNVITQL